MHCNICTIGSWTEPCSYAVTNLLLADDEYFLIAIFDVYVALSVLIIQHFV